MRGTVLLSGGLDSAACARFMSSMMRVDCLFIDFGQPAAKFESKSAEAIARHLHVCDSGGAIRSSRANTGMGNLVTAVELYQSAFEYVNSKPLRDEVTWQREADFGAFSEQDFLRESAWVILCSGFRESVVRRAFDHISLAFCDWESASSIAAAGPTCVRAALSRFRNSRKLNAILRVSEVVDGIGFEELKRQVLARPIERLMGLPYIGSVTARHLAKNLGLNVAKPDRHLLRLSAKLQFCCADHLCVALSEAVGEAPKVVDLILWRYLADNARVRSAVFA